MRPAYSSPRGYGSRGHLRGADSGIRRVAPTFGKALFRSSSPKLAGSLLVESDAERLIAHMLTLDPEVSEFSSQPFTLDLIDGFIHRTPEARSEARAKHRARPGPKFYTPDFVVTHKQRPRTAVEVKLADFPGNDVYEEKLTLAQSILAAHGYDFVRIVFPADPKHPLRNNLPLLAKALLRTDLWPCQDQVQSIESVCGDAGQSVATVCRALQLSPNLVPFWLVSGTVAADVGRHPINGELRLTPAYGDLSHLQLMKEVAS